MNKYTVPLPHQTLYRMSYLDYIMIKHASLNKSQLIRFLSC